ncbi:MAG: hypothetical protein AB7N76_00170 [Planctomycetota bacterium]
MDLPRSIPDVLDVELLRGAEAAPDAVPDLLVEVPHGADRRADYDGLRARLVGDLPAGLADFFHMNTDVGAWAYGRATAQALLERDPRRSALVLRSLIPRTFIDCNRPADFGGDSDLSAGGVTAGIPAYVEDPRDLELLLELHRAYVTAAAAAYERVCGRGGLALVPHTYGPRTVGIEKVDRTIVEQLRWAHEPARYETWPLRAEVDLLTRDGEGRLLAPEGIEEALFESFAAQGFSPKANDTYFLHAATLGHGWSARYPGRLVCLEVRRDLLVPEWRPFEEMTATEAGVARVVAALVGPLYDLLQSSR